MMQKDIEELFGKANEFYEKYKDDELKDYILSIGKKLEDAEMMRHQFAYFLMHARSTVAYPVRPKHFQEALDRAEKYLKRFEEE
jgi:pyruvate/2-oxoacid:ferredoxin oxidoreductase alpha subunit